MRTVRAIDAAFGGRTHGPLVVSNNGGRLDRHDAARVVARLARRAGLAKHQIHRVDSITAAGR